MLGLNELIIIGIVILAVLFFGGKKLSELSKSAGKAIGEFKKGKLEAERELEEMEKKKGEAK